MRIKAMKLTDLARLESCQTADRFALHRPRLSAAAA